MVMAPALQPGLFYACNSALEGGMPEPMTNSGLSRILTLESVLTVLIILASGVAGYTSLAGDVEENKQDIKRWVDESKEARIRQNIKLDELSTDVSNIREGQGEFRAQIQAIIENQRRILRQLEEAKKSQ
jgi:hypothetical protein